MQALKRMGLWSSQRQKVEGWLPGELGENSDLCVMGTKFQWEMENFRT